MGFRFRRSIRLLPGIRWNFGLKSTSISIGGRGFHYTVGTKGARVGASLPGTGLSWSQAAPTPLQIAGPVPTGRRIWLPLIIFLGALFLAYVTSGPSPPGTKTTPSLPRSATQTSSASPRPSPVPQIPAPSATTSSLPTQTTPSASPRPNSVPQIPALSAYAKGLAALNEGDFDAAVAQFTTAIANDPRDPFSYIRRGTAYERKGDAASAIGDYRNVLKLIDAQTGAEYVARIRKLQKTTK
jgi:Protein of unknown function (DUF4236)/Tetratricopeptide repeat